MYHQEQQSLGQNIRMMDLLVMRLSLMSAVVRRLLLSRYSLRRGFYAVRYRSLPTYFQKQIECSGHYLVGTEIDTDHSEARILILLCYEIADLTIF